MEIAGKIVALTGAGGGIGAALAEACAHAGAAHVAVSDLNLEAARAVAARVGGSAYRVDVSNEAEMAGFIASVEKDQGRIDLFCSNAGILIADPDFDNAASAPNAAWEKCWQANVMAHVYAMRALLPGMKARGGGHVMLTASAAGLLSIIGAASYATTKHAVIGLAEAFAITHKDDGIGVSVLCPQAVDTDMTRGKKMMGADVDGVARPEDVAAAALAGLAAGRFVILPHPNVAAYVANKSENYERWIGGMAKMRRALKAQD